LRSVVLGSGVWITLEYRVCSLEDMRLGIGAFWCPESAILEVKKPEVLGRI